MLKLNLNYLFNLRAVTKKMGFLKNSGFTHSKANRFATENVKTFSIDDIFNLCLTFHCTPNELFEFIPDTSRPIPPDHPLNTLIHQPTINVPEFLNSLSIEKLKDLTKKIEEMKNQ